MQQVLNDLALHRPTLPGGVWPEPTTSAIVLPVAKPGQNAGAAGVLVAGINPRRALDDAYRGFSISSPDTWQRPYRMPGRTKKNATCPKIP